MARSEAVFWFRAKAPKRMFALEFEEETAETRNRRGQSAVYRAMASSTAALSN